MLNISRRDIDEAYASMRDAHSYIQRFQGGGETVVGQLTQSLAVGAGAFGVGVLSGRYGALHINGSSIPLDLAAGLTGHALGFFGIAGKYSEHLHNFSDGVLSAWLTKLGVGVGAKMAMDAGKPAPPVTAGAPRLATGFQPSTRQNHRDSIAGRAPLTEAELAGMAHSIR